MNHLPFEEARLFVHRLGLKKQKEWREYCKSGRKTSDIPTHPERAYKDQWISWGDWFGTGTIATFKRKYLDFETARAHVRALNLKDQYHWMEYCKSGTKPEEIPGHPERVYKKQWKSLADLVFQEIFVQTSNTPSIHQSLLILELGLELLLFQNLGIFY